MTAQDTSDVNAPADDAVNHPRHYNVHPSGIECIDIAELLTFNMGNCLKYCWRAGEKLDAAEDLKKARWYLDRELARHDDLSPAELGEEGEILKYTRLARRLTPLQTHTDLASQVAVAMLLPMRIRHRTVHTLIADHLSALEAASK